MRSAAHIEGHPIHPMLVGFPIAYLLGSACLDLWGRATGRRELFRTASSMNALGLATAVAAAVPGLVDYAFTVPPDSSAKDRATDHLFANLSALGLFALARAGRRDDETPRAWSVMTELAGAGLLGVAGWLGGTLVTRNQISVNRLHANATESGVAVLPDKKKVDAGSVDDLEVDQMKLLRVGDKRIVLARTEKGYVAFDDACPHKGGSLADGALACETVQCPWHGSQFDVTTGKVKQGPAEDPIATYDVEERDGRVIVDAVRHRRASSRR
jgi:nitrite reductase/ring-hydroxylating ferredoxin subunit/uncharacterized membrane protein